MKVQRTLMRVRKQWADWTGRSGQVYFHHRVAEYRGMWKAIAEDRHGRFTELAADIWQVEVDGVMTRIHNHEMEFDNPVVLGLAGRKPVVHRLLQGAGIHVPEYEVFTLGDLEAAGRFVDRYPGGCVVKPADGYGGQGVTTHVRGREEMRRAALLASLYGHELLIEAQIPGESYRLLVLDGKVIHAVCRRGPRLPGDGSSTVRQLLEAENTRRRTGGQPVLDVDRDCLFTLEYQGLSLDARPAAGTRFLVKTVNDPDRKVEVRTVYNDIVTDLICPSIRQDAEAAARLVGSEFLGVDVITTDPTVPLRESGGVVNEVNTTPALHHHYDASREKYPRVALMALDVLLRKKAESLVGGRS
jgi:cyanophycin synthetase